ncbi:hypothetical protein GCM10025868_17510 [Angustibacter aerolatus]|uniref:Nudix hydrolase domain-containing protein n=1 Tax=Angustibacter aerolatus TaxID=1162965 RepID=A0ABQ6JE72_9ACTN|nr:hypothetical protein GCM10025868_17510 [Angustibacter aerolatus]
MRLDLALPDFAYRATSAEGLVEHEVCPVFTATVDADPVPDPDEVGDWRWVDWAEYRRTAARLALAAQPLVGAAGRRPRGRRPLSERLRSGRRGAGGRPARATGAQHDLVVDQPARRCDRRRR